MRYILALVLTACASPAVAQQVSGPAIVIDGDSLTVAGRPVRLFGIDAPEGQQTCARGGAAWACGEEAARQLRALVESREVHCEGRAIDQFGRLLARCTANSFELNQSMVEAGWATAFRRYSDDYVGVELGAKTAKLGIWSSSFEPPESWRLAREPAPRSEARLRFVAPRAQAQNSGQFGCAIKGNRNRRGQWIYHLPGFPYYDATRAEEMFCSEAEAQAAGYRRAIVR